VIDGVGPEERRVPFGIWAVAILVTLLWIIVILDATGIRPSNSNTILADAVGTNAALNWIAGGIAVVGIAGAIALIRLKPIGFVITVVLAGIGLFNTLASELVGKGDDLRLGLIVLAVLYLNQPSVRAVFGRADDPDRTVPRGAEGE
jgi:hypothetical protein